MVSRKEPPKPLSAWIRGHWINYPHFYTNSSPDDPRGLSDPRISHYTLPRELDKVVTVVLGEW